MRLDGAVVASARFGIAAFFSALTAVTVFIAW